MKKLRAIVTGRVQGVWYRAHTRDKAVELGVAGFVRNLADGSVEIVAQGEDARVEALLEWARSGPPLAEVRDVRIQESAPEEDFERFQVLY